MIARLTHGRISRCALAVLAVALALPASFADERQPSSTITLLARTRTDGDVKLESLQWKASETAVVICDMWDDHYCRNSARRVAEMAPRMNKVIAEARRRGALIIHSPSGCMNVYKDTPQRKLALQAPPFKTKVPLKKWCYLDPKLEAEMPVDASVPCEDEKPRERKRFYTRQISTLKIEDGDAITDSAEALYLMKQRGIKNVILMGVHTNMCVLGRPFGIRQLVYQDKNVVLMRDMTDSMYNPKCRPYVSHVRGTELIVEHIEKHWCPTVVSTALTGKAAFRFGQDMRPHVVFVVAPGEYDADKTMPKLAATLREHGFHCDVLVGRGKGKDFTIPGLDALKDADLMVLFMRRRALPKEQLDAIRAYHKSGRPLVALRTASHAFEVRGAPAEAATWAKFDVEVLGCDYHGHGPNKAGTDVTVVKENATHPVLTGIAEKKWHSEGSLYNSKPLANNVTVLLEGSIPKTTEPVAWTREYGKSRVFYTSLGHPSDLKQEAFRRLLTNAVHWALDKPIPKEK